MNRVDEINSRSLMDLNNQVGFVTRVIPRLLHTAWAKVTSPAGMRFMGKILKWGLGLIVIRVALKNSASSLFRMLPTFMQTMLASSSATVNSWATAILPVCVVQFGGDLLALIDVICSPQFCTGGMIGLLMEQVSQRANNGELEEVRNVHYNATTTFSARIKDLQALNEELKEDLRQAKISLESYKNSNAVSEATIASLQQEIINMEDTIAALNREILQLEQENAEQLNRPQVRAQPNPNPQRQAARRNPNLVQPQPAPLLNPGNLGMFPRPAKNNVAASSTQPAAVQTPRP